MSATTNQPVYLPGTTILPNMSGHRLLRKENITFTGGNPWPILVVVGVIAVAAAVGGSMMTLGHSGIAHALASFHIGVMACLAMSLGSLFYLQANMLTNSGWYAAVRRQMENIASLAPIFGLLAILTPLLDFFVFKGVLFTWMNSDFVADAILSKKAAFFAPAFFFGRGAVYILIWTWLTRTYMANSLAEDRDGSRMWATKSRGMAAVGMMLTALSLAFCAFDWLMSFDFRFFSTMWGVYYFAGAAYSGIAVVILVLAYLRKRGLLEGVITEEHFHDLGKFQFAFTVFWAYIAFSQYFLIWYSNIPEETAWYVYRKSGSWNTLFYTLCFGHFLVPFLIMLFRDVKRNFNALTLMALWALAMEVADMTFIVKPMVFIRELESDHTPANTWWVTALAAIGLLAFFAGLVLRKIPQHPLVAVNDPRMAESLKHKNNV